MRRASFFTAALLSVVISGNAHALDVAPPATADQSPLSLIFGLPVLAPGQTLTAGEQRATVSYEISNFMFYDRRNNEELVLDGETRRAVIAFFYGNPHGEWGVEIPYVSHSGGMFDSFIRHWHETFGQRQGGRDETPDNLLSFSYRRDGSDRFSIIRSTEGIGDIRLLSAWRLATGGATDIALRASLKLPTGDAAQLHGSGATDVALWLAANCATDRCPAPFAWNASAGILRLGHGDTLPELQERYAGFGHVGLNWEALSSITLKAALSSHTSFYRDTDFAPLSHTSVQLILGGTWAASRQMAFDIAVTEDLRVYTAPDVGIQLRARAAF